MRTSNGWPLIFLALLLPGSVNAAEIAGTVSEASGETATVVLEGDLLPSIGDKAEIFFKLEGEDVSVATGNVAEVSATSAKVKITETTGTVSKDQSARITSEQPSKKPAAAATSTNAATAAPVADSGSVPQVQGDWTGVAPDKSVISFSFKEDNSVLWVVTDTASDVTLFAHGKYRVDTTKTPGVLDIYDIEEGDLKGETLHGIFEFQSDGRLKYDASVGFNEHPEQGFTTGAMLMSRAASPIVIPPGATLTAPKKDAVAAASAAPSATPEPTIDASKPPDEQQVQIGDRCYERGDTDGAIEAYTKAIKLNPKNHIAYLGRASAFHKKEDYDAAIADYKKVGALDPKYKEELKNIIESSETIRDAKKKTRAR